MTGTSVRAPGRPRTDVPAPDARLDTRSPRSAAIPRPASPRRPSRPAVIEDIQIKAELARYRIRGFGVAPAANLGHVRRPDVHPGTLTRIPLEGYREACSTRTVLGTRFASQADRARHPADGHRDELRRALAERQGGAVARGADGGDVDDHRRRRHARRRADRVAGDDLRGAAQPLRHRRPAPPPGRRDRADDRPGGQAGHRRLAAGSKVSEEIARLRDLPPGVDQRSPCRHPDFLGPDDLVIKIEELREATDYRVPIFVKMGASRVFDDVRLAAKAGADVIVVDGMEGGTGASPELLQEHTGIPTLAAVCEARAALEDIGLYGKVQLVIAGGLRHGSDCAKALALGADACYLGTALLIALNCNKPIYVEDYHKIGAAPYSCHHCHTGRCPVGITTQDPEL